MNSQEGQTDRNKKWKHNNEINKKHTFWYIYLSHKWVTHKAKHNLCCNHGVFYTFLTNHSGVKNWWVHPFHSSISVPHLIWCTPCWWWACMDLKPEELNKVTDSKPTGALFKQNVHRFPGDFQGWYWCFRYIAFCCSLALHCCMPLYVLHWFFLMKTLLYYTVIMKTVRQNKSQ